MYRDARRTPVHVGVTAPDGFVISKWGGGSLLRHKPEMVPSTYGVEVTLYDALHDKQSDYLWRVFRNLIVADG